MIRQGASMSVRENTSHAERLTLRKALDDLGWFYATFSSLVGGPSLLALLQMVFVEYRFVDALQWIVDGYNDILAVLGNAVEPLLAPLIAWLNALLDWRLELQPHWKPLLMLMMVLVVSMGRTSLRQGFRWGEALLMLAQGAGALLGAIVAGLTPIDGDWAVQGFTAAAPLLSSFLLFAPTFALLAFLIPAARSQLLATAGFVLRFGVVLATLAFVLGAAVSFGLRSGAGLATLAVLIFWFASFLIRFGLWRQSAPDVRAGLTMIGGFLTAGLIVAADLIIKLIS